MHAKSSLFIYFFVLLVVLSACDTHSILTETSDLPTTVPEQQTPTPPPITPTATQTNTPTQTPLPTQTRTFTPTKVPFKGFLPGFSLYRAWNDGETTTFYFMQADFAGTLYARADDYDLVCNPDPQYPIHTICISDQKIFGQDLMQFDFFTDAARSDLVFSEEYSTGLADDTVFYHDTDCALRGQDVYCESEYRLYDGRCYYAHTCYDACGIYYSRDNIPEVWTEFQGFTVPCD